MKSNHTPVIERLKARIGKLEARKEANHVPSRSRRQGNPYYMCRECEIHDPELSIQNGIQNGKHYGRCSMGGIDKQIAHFKGLLIEAEVRRVLDIIMSMDVYRKDAEQVLETYRSYLLKPEYRAVMGRLAAEYPMEIAQS